MHEYLINNCTREEVSKLSKLDLDWYPDDMMSSDVCVYGTEEDLNTALKAIGRR